MKKLNCFWRKAEFLRILRTHAVALLAAALYFCFLALLGATCPIRLLTGHACPTCGMTRAMIALFCGDAKNYFAANSFALPVAAAVWTLFHVRNKGAKCIAFALLAANVLRYLFFCTLFR